MEVETAKPSLYDQLGGIGLTPKKYASGETDRNGGISKCGDAAMRAVLYQSAPALLTGSKKYSGIRVWGLGIAKRRGLRRAAVECTVFGLTGRNIAGSERQPSRHER